MASLAQRVAMEPVVADCSCRSLAPQKKHKLIQFLSCDIYVDVWYSKCQMNIDLFVAPVDSVIWRRSVYDWHTEYDSGLKQMLSICDVQIKLQCN